MPHAGEQGGDASGRVGFFERFWRRKEQGEALGVDEDQRSESNLDGGARLALFRDGIGEAEFVRLAEFSDGAEQALRRARRTESGAEFHHRLIPISRGTRVEKVVGGSL